MASDPPTLGTRILRARERARLNQEQLAKAVGASVRAVSDWENDRRKPRNRLGALEEVLGVTLSGPEPEPVVPPDVLAAIRRELDPADQQRVIDAVERTLRGEPQPPPTSPLAEDPSSARQRQAGLRRRWS